MTHWVGDPVAEKQDGWENISFGPTPEELQKWDRESKQLKEIVERNRKTNALKATIDFEGRSACSLKDCGSWKYSLHPTTELLCMAFRLPHWEHGRTALWHPAFPNLGIEESDCPELEELFQWIRDGKLVEAHNAWFERGIWVNICVPKLGWPEIGHRQWRCSAAKAASYSLPRSLDQLTSALNLSVRKDSEGAKVMKKMVKPRKARVKEVKEWIAEHGEDVPMPLLWVESVEHFNTLFAYCRQDVLAEEAASERLRDLSPSETEMYLMDQSVNQRGFQLDREAVEAALQIIDTIYQELNQELVDITEGQVTKATQRQKMKDWFADNGLFLTDTQGATIDAWLLKGDLSPKVRRCLMLVRALGRSSTAKYVAMQDWASQHDWRVRGGLLYHGAGTGRWSGSGVQPHNFPRGNVKDMVAAWADIKGMDVEWLEFLYGDVMELLAGALRGAIIPTPGKKLFVADYAAIEARVLFWLVEDDNALGVFYRGECIYCDMATSIYGFTVIKGVHDKERQMGKQAVLGLGYQMGAPKFVDTVAKYGIVITEEFAKTIVDAYRTKYAKVKKQWWDQEAAAIAAVKSPGRDVRCGRIRWKVVDGFLHCRLPSGRLLSYPDPKVFERMTPWGAMKPVLTYMGLDSNTRKWRRQDTYGGMLVENIVQAIARDLMAGAMLRCETSGIYLPLLSVHDEMIAEADDGVGDVKEFEHMMAELPDWAKGCPVAAEGWAGYRYRK